MKRFLLAPTALCVALLVPSSASAFNDGSYSGKTSQNQSMRFKVVSKIKHVGRRIVHTRYIRVANPWTTFAVTCPDGKVFRIETHSSPAVDLAINSAGKFSWTLPRGGFPLTFSGRLSGGRHNSVASGKVNDTLNGETHGHSCTTGQLNWSARHT
jgi:hypothetical protein